MMVTNVCDCSPFLSWQATMKTAAVDRLTDAAKYTGSHKMRFDEAGRGRGIDGRKDIPDGSGYVQGYTHKNTYDKSH